jgi:hypothetical protein
MTPEQKQAAANKAAGVDPKGKPVTKSPTAPNLSAGLEKELAEAGGTIQLLNTSAEEVSRFKSWGEMTAARAAAGLDPEANLTGIRNVVDLVARRRSGAAIPPAEYAKIEKFVAGDLTLTPTQVANYLKATAERERIYAKTVLTGALELSSNPSETKMFDPPVPKRKRNPGESYKDYVAATGG